jgi:hypothetical protein
MQDGSFGLPRYLSAEWVLSLSLLMNCTVPDTSRFASAYELRIKIFYQIFVLNFFRRNFLDVAE